MQLLFNNKIRAENQAIHTAAHNFAHAPRGSVQWFESLVEKSASGPFAEIVDVTPELAEYILSKNDGNRKTVEHNVIKIATDIEKGLWELNGETIIISVDGYLNDGQHRLQAVSLAGKTVEMLLFFGASRNSRFTVDMGAARSCGHLLGMDGVTDSNVMAAASKILLIWSRNAHTNADHIAGTKQEVRAFFQQNRQLFEDAHKAVVNNQFASAFGRSVTVAGYVILHEANAAACEEFFEKLINGAGLQKGCPVLQARNHFMGISKERLHNWEKLELLIRYWNAWRRNKTASRNLHTMNEWPKVEG